MLSEETPLLVSDHNLIYKRFTPWEKKGLVIIVSSEGFLACTFLPECGMDRTCILMNGCSIDVRNNLAIDPTNGHTRRGQLLGR
jgi:hypothetical protein